ncbi:MAG TPA: ketoacyl-ACP synthase III family protein [Actinocrinis sp.]|jgi:3-oxoacyl-[acyl-carrier-protein] synthase III
MKLTNVYLSGLGVYQPPTVDTREAARRGEYHPGFYQENKFTGLCVAGDVPPVEMAVQAGRQALSRAGDDPGRVGLLLHTAMHWQGPEGWNAAAYIQKNVVGGTIPAFEIRVGCGGLFAALELAAPRLDGPGSDETVLVTTAENFGTQLVDRWNALPGYIQGDAGSALLLDRNAGFARLRALGCITVSEVEQLYRGGEPLWPPTLSPGEKPDMRPRVTYFRENVMALAEANEIIARSLVKVIEQTLDEAERSLDDIARVVYMNAASFVMHQQLLEPLGIPMERTTWDFGRGLGHCGANDQPLSLNHLLVTGQLQAGDHVLVAGGGPAMVAAAVLEILEVPEWALA